MRTFRSTNTYWYPTPAGESREIGVTQGLGGLWIVAWIKPNGSAKRIKSPSLEPSPNPYVMEERLRLHANRLGLQPAGEVVAK